MRLSEAINLGRSLIKHGNGSRTLSRGEGCACGMGLAAVGESIGSKDTMAKHWPWVTGDIWWAISDKYNSVFGGTETLDQLIDWVRSIEPAEEETPLSSPEVARPETVRA